MRTPGSVDLAVYNLRGEMVKRLISGSMEAGEHEVQWNGRDNRDASLASGVYFARFVSGKVAVTQRLVLLQ
jgi:flagellar hook assembly protein FlgD